MGVGAANKHIVGRNTGGFLNQPAGLDAQAAMKSQEVADDERKLRFAVVEYQATRMKLIVNMLRRRGNKSTNDIQSDFRSDNACRRPSTQW